jgi:hypothetical protein
VAVYPYTPALFPFPSIQIIRVIEYVSAVTVNFGKGVPGCESQKEINAYRSGKVSVPPFFMVVCSDDTGVLPDS